MMMDSAPAQRRLKAINGHLISDGEDQSLLLRPNATAGEFVSGAFSLSLFLFLLWKSDSRHVEAQFPFCTRKARDRFFGGGLGFFST